MRCKAQIHRIFEQDSMLLKEDYQNIFSTPFPKKMQVIAHDFLMKSQVHLFGCRNVGSTFEKVKVKSLGLVRLLRTDPMDCSPPGSSVCGILQARILEWVAISSSRRSSRPKDQTPVSCIILHWQVESLPLHQLRGEGKRQLLPEPVVFSGGLGPTRGFDEPAEIRA